MVYFNKALIVMLLLALTKIKNARASFPRDHHHHEFIIQDLIQEGQVCLTTVLASGAQGIMGIIGPHLATVVRLSTKVMEVARLEEGEDNLTGFN